MVGACGGPRGSKVTPEYKIGKTQVSADASDWPNVILHLCIIHIIYAHSQFTPASKTTKYLHSVYA